MGSTELCGSSVLCGSSELFGSTVLCAKLLGAYCGKLAAVAAVVAMKTWEAYRCVYNLVYSLPFCSELGWST